MDTPFIKNITGTQHYDDVLARVASVKHTLWIGTADIKDVYVKAGAKAMPLLAVLDLLVKRGISMPKSLDLPFEMTLINSQHCGRPWK